MEKIKVLKWMPFWFQGSGWQFNVAKNILTTKSFIEISCEKGTKLAWEENRNLNVIGSGFPYALNVKTYQNRSALRSVQTKVFFFGKVI